MLTPGLDDQFMGYDKENNEVKGRDNRSKVTHYIKRSSNSAGVDNASNDAVEENINNMSYAELVSEHDRLLEEYENFPDNVNSKEKTDLLRKEKVFQDELLRRHRSKEYYLTPMPLDGNDDDGRL